MDFVVKIILTKAIQNAAENVGLNGKIHSKCIFWVYRHPTAASVSDWIHWNTLCRLWHLGMGLGPIFKHHPSVTIDQHWMRLLLPLILTLPLGVGIALTTKGHSCSTSKATMREPCLKEQFIWFYKYNMSKYEGYRPTPDSDTIYR